MRRTYFFNLENPADQRCIADAQLAREPLLGLIVIDEIRRAHVLNHGIGNPEFQPLENPDQKAPTLGNSGQGGASGGAVNAPAVAVAARAEGGDKGGTRPPGAFKHARRSRSTKEDGRANCLSAPKIV